ncbi:MAG: aminotransferase class I/II-fold pyridoxal phosphate-dependent enzyme, partial [Bacteroidales bacterium]
VAGIRMGLAFASEEIIYFMSKVKYPYNINILTQEAALNILKQEEDIREMIKTIQRERDELAIRIKSFPFIEKVYTSDSNFLLVKCFNPKKIYNFLLKEGIIVRDRSNVPGCESCLRISIGTPEENSVLIKTLLTYELSL